MGVRGIGDYSVLSDAEMEIVLEKFKNYGLNVKHKTKDKPKTKAKTKK